MNLIVVWLAAVLIVYTYLGFPLLLLLRSLVHRRAVTKAAITPRVSLVVVAHNEASMIAAKLDNINSLDYPGDKLDVVLASDGSDDGTNEVVRRYLRPGLRLLALPRCGKIPALNAAVAMTGGEILVFSDANSLYAPGALRALVAPFADPTVGAVGGDQRYQPTGPAHLASFPERVYWNYDRLLKAMQSRAGHMTAATGAIHAIRRELFRPVPLGVSDDFMTSTRAIAQGYRLVFEPNAIAYETVAPSEGAEFHRKLRIMVRGLRGLWVVRELFNPLRYGFYSLQLVSHKLLRWSVCWLLLILLVASVGAYGEGQLYRWIVHAQAGFYGCASLGLLLRNSRHGERRVFKPLGVAFYFCMANFAALSAWVQLVSGKRVDAWESRRSASALAR